MIVSPGTEEVTAAVPVIIRLVPSSWVSVTVTVAVLLWPTSTVVGSRLTVVEVERLFTVRSAELVLPEWTSVAVKVAVMVWVLAQLGVTLTAQVEYPECGVNSQRPAMVSPDPDVTVTVPVGATFVPSAWVSVTVTVVSLPCSTTTVAGLKLIATEVERLFTV